MKNTIMRDNARGVKHNPYQPKSIQSQSPPHKKLLKKIEATQKDTQTKYEYSLQDNLVKPETKVEVQDFRVEIERRFQRSLTNKSYIFPRSLLDNEQSSSYITTDSEQLHNISGESLKYVTVYDLASQNNKIYRANHKIKPKVNSYMQNNTNEIQKTSNINTERNEIIKNHISNDMIINNDYENDNGNNDIDPNDIDNDNDDNDENTHTNEDELEIQIRDKSSKAYKRLIELLEHQFNKANNPGFIASKEVQNKHEPIKLIENQSTKNIIHMAVSQPNPTTTTTTNTNTHIANANTNFHHHHHQYSNKSMAISSGLISNTNNGNGNEGYAIGNNNIHMYNNNNMHQVNKNDPNNIIKYVNTNETETSRHTLSIKDKLNLSKTNNTNNMNNSQYNNISSNNSQYHQPQHHLKKTFSQERPKIAPNIDSNSFVEKSITQNSHNSTRVNGAQDQGKIIQQDVMKKLYNANLMKSITPKYLNSKINLLNTKDAIFKTYNPDTYPGQYGVSITGNNTTSHSKVQSNILYQKAKNEVMNSKMKSLNNKSVKYPSNTTFHTNAQTTKRDESPSKEELKKIALSNLYSPGNDTNNTEKIFFGSSSSNKLSKKSSVKAMQMVSPLKIGGQDRDATTNRNGLYLNQGLSQQQQPVNNANHALLTTTTTNGTSQEKFYTKPLFKLDLSKRSTNNRDALTSGRNRNKTTDIFNTDSIIRLSHDYQNHYQPNQQQQQQQQSSFLNNSTQKNTSKKKIMFTSAIKNNNNSLSKTNSMSRNFN